MRHMYIYMYEYISFLFFASLLRETNLSLLMGKYDDFAECLRNYLVLYISFAKFCWKGTNQIGIGK